MPTFSRKFDEKYQSLTFIGIQKKQQIEKEVEKNKNKVIKSCKAAVTE